MSNRFAIVCLSLILLLGLLVRVAPVALNGGSPASVFSADSQLYWDLATNLADFGEFVRERGRYTIERIENPWPHEIFRTPGYPAFLAAIFFIGVRDPFGIIFIQIFLDLVAVGLTYHFAARLCGSRVGLMAALLLSLNISHVVQANMIMSDVLFLFFMLSAFIATSGLTSDRPTWRRVLVISMSLALASTVRPVGLIAGIIFAAYLFLRTRAVLPALALGALSLAFPLGWTVRNYVLTGQLTPSSALEYNLYLVTASKVMARGEGIPYSTAGETLSKSMLSDLDARGPQVWREVLKSHGQPIFYKYPEQTVIELCRAVVEMSIAGERRHLLRILNLPGGETDVVSLTEGRRKVVAALGDFVPARPTFEIILVGTQALLNILILILAVRGWRRFSDPYLKWFFVAILGYFVASSIVVATARMRMPIAPILVTLAALGAAPGDRGRKAFASATQ